MVHPLRHCWSARRGGAYPCSASELRAAITDGSIANIVHWHPVHQGDAIFIPAGTIHAIGAGIVLAEIQQHGDATFRLFDFGRQRELHIESAVAVTTAGPREVQSPPKRLSDARMVLSVNSHFALEQIDLAPGKKLLKQLEDAVDELQKRRVE